MGTQQWSTCPNEYLQSRSHFSEYRIPICDFFLHVCVLFQSTFCFTLNLFHLRWHFCSSKWSDELPRAILQPPFSPLLFECSRKHAGPCLLFKSCGLQRGGFEMKKSERLLRWKFMLRLKGWVRGLALRKRQQYTIKRKYKLLQRKSLS